MKACGSGRSRMGTDRNWRYGWDEQRRVKMEGETDKDEDGQRQMDKDGETDGETGSGGDERGGTEAGEVGWRRLLDRAGRDR